MQCNVNVRPLLLLLLLALWLPGRAQLTTLYATSVSSGTYTPITGGVELASVSFDDAVITTQLPSFFFNGSYYTTMYVSTNGFITFGSEPTTNMYAPIGNVAAYAGVIGPMACNLRNATSGTPEIRQQQLGNELVVQWQDVSRFSGVNERFSFQARLNITTGAVRFVYSSVSALDVLTGQQPQVGLRGSSNVFASQVKNFTVGTGTNTWAVPSPGTANSSQMRFTATAPAKSPLGGETYTFTPSCLSATATSTVASDCTTNSYTVQVNVNGLGTASAVNITATPGGTLYSNVGIGTYTCGPFPLGTAETIRVVSTSNAACTNLLGPFNPATVCGSTTNGTCIADPFLTIPDDGCATGEDLQVTIPISGMNTTLGSGPGQTFFQSFEFIMAHASRGAIQMRLTSPSGQTRDMLLNAPSANASGGNFGNPNACPGITIVLRDANAQPLSTMDPDVNNVSGFFMPEQPLAGFTGNANGNWILRICDGLTEDIGTLRFARLRMQKVDCAGVINGTAQPGTTCNDGDPNTTGDVYDANCTCTGTPANVTLALKGLLDGPYDAGTGLMHDSLRVRSLIPASEPYTALGFVQVGSGGASISPAVLATTGAAAIVDWVLVELRSAANSTVIQRTATALIQRDGDVVQVDGTTPLSFAVAPGNYFVALRHRNHLGVMTGNPVALAAATATVDLSSPATGTYGTGARKAVSGVEVLWAGNVLRNASVGYTGASNDRDPILVEVGSTTPNNTVTGYLQTDVNLDGRVTYTGGANDRDPILVNVGSTTPNNLRAEQLP
jgi:hypothetical protein